MTKYGARAVTIDGIRFHSKVEGDYYIYLKSMKDRGLIKDFELQPKFELIPKFEKHGEKHRSTSYVADFRVFFNDGTTEIIDIKGMLTPEFKLKYKEYCNKFDEPIRLLRYVEKYGGWITVKEHEKLKREARKKKGE